MQSLRDWLLTLQIGGSWHLLLLLFSVKSAGQTWLIAAGTKVLILTVCLSNFANEDAGSQESRAVGSWVPWECQRIRVKCRRTSWPAISIVYSVSNDFFVLNNNSPTIMFGAHEQVVFTELSVWTFVWSNCLLWAQFPTQHLFISAPMLTSYKSLDNSLRACDCRGSDMPSLWDVCFKFLRWYLSQPSLVAQRLHLSSLLRLRSTSTVFEPQWTIFPTTDPLLSEMDEIVQYELSIRRFPAAAHLIQVKASLPALWRPWWPADGDPVMWISVSWRETSRTLTLILQQEHLSCRRAMKF